MSGRGFYFGNGTRVHEAVAIRSDGWASMWCGLYGPTKGRAAKVWPSGREANCRACAKSKAKGDT